MAIFLALGVRLAVELASPSLVLSMLLKLDGDQLSRTRSAHARWFPNADVAFMDASRRNAGLGMDGHVDMMRALSVQSDASVIKSNF